MRDHTYRLTPDDKDVIELAIEVLCGVEGRITPYFDKDIRKAITVMQILVEDYSHDQ